MPSDVPADATLLRHIPATSAFVRLDAAGSIDSFEPGVFPWDHYDSGGGVSFYVEAMLSEKYPTVENVAGLVSVAGYKRSPTKKHRYFVVKISAAVIREHGFDVRLAKVEPDDEGSDPTVDFAHAIATSGPNSPRMTAAEFRAARKPFISEFDLAYGETDWLKS